MPATPTARLKIPLPSQTDPADVPTDLGKLANALDPVAAVFGQSAGLSARPAAGTAGRLWGHQPGQAASPALAGRAVAYDDGAAWQYMAGVPELVIPSNTGVASTQLPKNGDCDVGQLLDLNIGTARWRMRFTGTAWGFVGGDRYISRQASNQSFGNVPVDSTYRAIPNGPQAIFPLDGTYALGGGVLSSTGAQSGQTGVNWLLAVSDGSTNRQLLALGQVIFTTGLTGATHFVEARSIRTSAAVTHGWNVFIVCVVGGTTAVGLAAATSELEVQPVSLTGNP